MELKNASLVLICLFGFACCSQPNENCAFGSYPPKNREEIPTYNIHLDLPPALRWKELATNETEKIKEIFQAIRDLLMNITGYAEYLIHYVDNDLEHIVKTFPYPYADEMMGLADAAKLPLGEVVLYNMMYEVFTLCTSILAHDDNGNLYHARNLDFGLLMGWDVEEDTWKMTEILKKSVVNLVWTNQGQVVFKSVGFAGYMGVLTGLKQGAFSLTVNERFSLDGGFLGIFKWFLGYRGSNWLTFLTRDIMEAAQNYEEAKGLLTSTELVAPVYFILGGREPTEGCIITRSRRETVDVWNIGEANSTWYLVETNYDHWQKVPFYDDRRSSATNCMNSLSSKNVGFAGLYDVLSSKPVLNKLTTYTTVMQVSTGKMETYIQHCPDPCSPW